jgi:hypothetical protein
MNAWMISSPANQVHSPREILLLPGANPQFQLRQTWIEEIRFDLPKFRKSGYWKFPRVQSIQSCPMSAPTLKLCIGVAATLYVFPKDFKLSMHIGKAHNLPIILVLFVT